MATKPLPTVEEQMDASDLLKALRWREDMLITNDFGERVWLAPCFDKDGNRIGITDCCFEEDPCAWHKSVAESGAGAVGLHPSEINLPPEGEGE